MSDERIDVDEFVERAIGDTLEDQSGAPFTPVGLDDLRIVRDDDGKVHPLDVLTPLEATPVRLRPLTYADRQRYKLQLTQDDMTAADIPITTKYEMIRRHIVEPSFDGVTRDDLVRDFGWTTIDDLVTAVMMYSRDAFRRPLLKLEARNENGAQGKA
jgi:hypothetical protein